MTTTPPPSGHTKQYVFVDEYNRHKRLKVMRACDGCRKRKIRCDGALQNGPWPCGACVRLKLKCVPPTLDPDEEPTTPDSATSQHTFSFQNTTFPAINQHHVVPDVAAPKPQLMQQLQQQHQQHQHPGANMVQEWAARLPPPGSNPSAGPTSAPLPPLDFDAAAAYGSHAAYNPQQMLPRGVAAVYPEDDYYGSPTDPTSHFPTTAPQAPQPQQPQPQSASSSSRQMPPALLRADTVASVDSAGDPQEIDAGVRELTEHMGDFRIESTSEAPYITFQKTRLADAPAAVEEPEVVLPASATAADATVRIPPEMMPSDERAMDFFGYYFEHVHPYVPVLNRAQFYEQWQNDRGTISPLLLEAIFACVARYLEEPLVAKKWLALAEKHEESFKDVPRLSTLQAMILLTKARESLSKRGYYWRSWMAVKYMCTMSVDLGLHEHYDYHRGDADTCVLPKPDCMVRTRIWQTLSVLELLVGAPMGRSDFAIDPQTVQFTLPAPGQPDVDGFEHETSRRGTYLAQAAYNIKISNMLWQKMKRLKTDWALDPEFVRHNHDLPAWLKNLPIDLQIHYPDDGSAPWIGSDHFLAYLHIYHHLVVIMHHRPQLQAMLERRDPAWRVHLDICLNSAKLMCRIQEALHRDFGFHGLQFMQRGINFTIYCVLTCTMLHLAAITSPDPFLNTQARIFFTRHMRIVEHCLPYSNPEMQVQINALREAFSVDTSKEFELKPTLGLRSPSMDSHPTPPSTNSGPVSAPLFSTPAWTNGAGAPNDPLAAAAAAAAVSRTLTPSSEYASPFDHPSTGAGGITSQPTTLPYANGTAAAYALPPRTNYPVQQPLSLVTANNTHPSSYGASLDPHGHNETPSPVWDPSGIFQSWNTAFGGAAAAAPPTPGTQQQPQPGGPTTPQSQASAATQQQQQQHAAAIAAVGMSSASQQQPPHGSPSPSHPAAAAAAQGLYHGAGTTPSPPAGPAPGHVMNVQPTVTPVMWQDAFTNAFVSGHGVKRYREASVGDAAMAEAVGGVGGLSGFLGNGYAGGAKRRG